MINQNITPSEFEEIQNLVGPISIEDLTYVESYICPLMGIFIPSVGYCQYAIRPKHTHPGFSYVLFFNQKETIFENFISIPANHYPLAALSPEIPHEEKEGDEFLRYLAFFIDEELITSLYQEIYQKKPPTFAIWYQTYIHHDVLNYIKNFIQEFTNKLPGYQQQLISLSKIIALSLIRALEEGSHCESKNSCEFTMENLIDYMHQNYNKPISLLELANLSGHSKAQLLRVFRKKYDTTPFDYLLKLRLEKARALLLVSNDSITEIALSCGFGSGSHLTSAFQKLFHTSPSEYRKHFSVPSFSSDEARKV